MEIASLVTALLLPWALGYLWLRALELRLTAQAGSHLRQLGYGYFLGIAALQGVIFASNGLFQSVSFWHIQLLLLLLTAPAVITLRSQATCNTSGSRPVRGQTGGPGLLGYLLLCWLSLHLLLNIVEILYRPVFPWDAWLNWMYRARVWYFHQELLPFSSPAQWLSGENSAVFNLSGHTYPSLVPITAFWMATALGEWSETLVNVPVIFCGIALGLALYSQCRESGAGRLVASSALFFLLSMPLVGTHLSLGGKADIWMAGFTGLGLVALIRGISFSDRFQIGLGLVLCLLAALVKQEGITWSIVALALLLVSSKLKITLSLAALLLASGIIAWLSGHTLITVAGIGSFGFDENTLYLPLIGEYQLKQFYLWDDYLVNFFVLDSWHILWCLLLLSLPLLWLCGDRRISNTILCFYVLFFCSQLLIFGFTALGRWAEDSTAINRLPIHFTPAILYCLALPLLRLQQSREGSVGSPVSRSGPVLPGVIALAVTCGILVLYLAASIPENHNKSRIFQPSEMRAVSGRARLNPTTGQITAYNNGIAILSSGRGLQLSAEELNSVQITLSGENRNFVRFFWRTEQDTSKIASLTLDKRGRQILDLTQSPAWRGSIVELGLMFYDDGGRDIAFEAISLQSMNLATSLWNFWDDITTLDYWSQRSVNWTTGGSNGANVPLTLLVMAWLVIALATARALNRRQPLPAATLLVLTVIAWMALDLRWTVNRVQQGISTVSTFASPESRTALDTGGDILIKGFVDQARKLVPDNNSRILITADNPNGRFQVLRAKYHLLPLPAYGSEAPLPDVPPHPVDFIIFIHATYLQPGQKKPSAQQIGALLRAKYQLEARALLNTDVAILFQLGSGPAINDPGAK